jgi:hypothetical protein
MPDASTPATGILFVSPPPHDHVLILRDTTTDGTGTWRLPCTVEDVAADIYVEPVAAFDALVARVDVEFEPALTEKHDASGWINPEFAASAGGIDPSAVAVLQKFSRARRFAQVMARIDSSEPYLDIYPTLQGDPMSTLQEFATVQAKADRVAQAFGDSAERWLDGETLANYTRRLLNRFKAHSPAWKDKDLARVDASVLDIAEAQIYADSMAAAASPTNVPAGQLVERHTRDQTGRSITQFFGDPAATWAPFKQPRRGILSIGGR